MAAVREDRDARAVEHTLGFFFGAPHLVVLVRCADDEPGNGVFEVIFRRGLDEDSEQIARNVSPFTVEPGKFTYRLVRGELEFPDYGQVFAHCRIDRGNWHVVPFTLLPPVE